MCRNYWVFAFGTEQAALLKFLCDQFLEGVIHRNETMNLAHRPL